jgi:hypothetical protein
VNNAKVDKFLQGLARHQTRAGSNNHESSVFEVRSSHFARKSNITILLLISIGERETLGGNWQFHQQHAELTSYGRYQSSFRGKIASWDCGTTIFAPKKVFLFFVNFKNSGRGKGRASGINLAEVCQYPSQLTE